MQTIVATLAEAPDYIVENQDDAGKIIAAAFKMKPEADDFATIKFYDLNGNLEFYSMPASLAQSMMSLKRTAHSMQASPTGI